MSEDQPRRRTVHRAGAALERISPYRRPRKDYPHDIHPALVPGISIDEQRRRYRLDMFVFVLGGALAVAFIIWGAVNLESVDAATSSAFDWTMEHAGWLFNVLAMVVLTFVLVLALSPFGRIRLGRDDEEPEYSTFAWVSMLFAAGIGIGVLFFGPSEPLTYFHTPPPLTVEPETVEAIHTSMAQTYYHWGFHAWAMYAVVGAAVAYAAYRRGRVLLMSSIFETLFGKPHAEGLAGRLVDMFAIVATLFGTAAALGIAALQIGQGVTVVTDVEITEVITVGIIAVLTCGFIVSAVSGVSRGIRCLSSINIVLTVGIVGLVFLLGPTLFLLNLLPSALMEYLGSFFELMGRSASWGEETLDFQSTWTVFYWAWWISWSPFVGMFIARISRGRTLRQFLLGVTLIPSSLLFVAYGVMGGTSMVMYREGLPGFSDGMAPPEVLFTVIEQLPFVEWLPFVVMIVLAIFFITSADSASVVMGILSSCGDQNPRRFTVVFWGLVMAGVATIMLLIGGETALQGLQNLVIVTALPFAVVLVLLMLGFVRELGTDPQSMRTRYAQQAVADAVIDGVDRYGDDWQLQVVPSAPGEGAGKVLDSTASEYTDWYQRTDEDGNPVGYDFSTGTWEDGWAPQTGTMPAVPTAEEDASGSDPDASGSDPDDSGSDPDDLQPRP